MFTSLFLALGLAAAGQAVSAETPPVEDDYVEPVDRDQPVACVAAQVIVPPFNNTPAAMDQSRVAATAVMRENARRGGKPVRVCQTSAVSPKLSRIKHGYEVPIDPEYEPEERTQAPRD